MSSPLDSSDLVGWWDFNSAAGNPVRNKKSPLTTAEELKEELNPQRSTSGPFPGTGQAGKCIYSSSSSSNTGYFKNTNGTDSNSGPFGKDTKSVLAVTLDPNPNSTNESQGFFGFKLVNRFANNFLFGIEVNYTYTFTTQSVSLIYNDTAEITESSTIGGPVQAIAVYDKSSISSTSNVTLYTNWGTVENSTTTSVSTGFSDTCNTFVVGDESFSHSSSANYIGLVDSVGYWQGTALPNQSTREDYYNYGSSGEHRGVEYVDIINNAPTASLSVTNSDKDLTVNADASNSSDPDGDSLTYSYDWGDGSTVGSGNGPSHTYSSAGNYTVTVTVDDGFELNNTDTDTANVTAYLNDLEVNDSGTIKTPNQLKANDGGTVKDVKEVWVNDGGTLKKVYDNPDA